MNILTDIGQGVLDILLTDNSLVDISFYEGYSANRITVPVRGVIACVLVNKCELKNTAAGKLTSQGTEGCLCSLSVETAVYTALGTGGYRCADAMGNIADVLLKRISELNVGLNGLHIVPVDYDSSIRAFKGSVIFDLTAYAEEEAEQ